MLHVSLLDRRQAPKYVIYNRSKYAYTFSEICEKQVAFAEINKIV